MVRGGTESLGHPGDQQRDQQTRVSGGWAEAAKSQASRVESVEAGTLWEPVRVWAELDVGGGPLHGRLR